jgi:hypothetical protein
MNLLSNRLMCLLVLGFTFLAAQSTLSEEPGFDMQLGVVGGAHRMIRNGVDQPALVITAWSIDGKEHDLTITFQVEDFFGNPVRDKIPELVVHVTADKSKEKLTIPLHFGQGYYSVAAQSSEGDVVLTRSSDFGVVPTPYPGTRPNSLFASNSAIKQGEDLQFLETIGMKLLRTHFEPQVKADDARWPSEFAPGQPVRLDFDRLDQTWADVKKHGLWVLPIVGYSFFRAGIFDRTPLAEKLKMYGPPSDNARFISTWETILRHYPELTTFEFWNEPWIYEWTWAGTPTDYRALQASWCSMALHVNSRYRILAGNSASFVRDNIEPFPASWDGLIQGVTHHPYTGAGSPNLRGGNLIRSIDEIRLAANDMGLRYAYLTEGGTVFANPESGNDPERYNNVENAVKLVQYYVATTLAGVYMGNAQWQIGYGPGWTRSNTAFAVMTHFLEDRVPLVDIWPKQELLWGGIFANRKFVTPEVTALPRAKELCSRWEVEVPHERDADDTKVAVLWSLTGPSADRLDPSGELVILDAADLRAFDLMGHEITPTQGRLIVPLTNCPVYITTERLSTLELRDRITLGVIRHITPVNCSAFSLMKSSEEPQSLSVRLESQLNRHLDGTVVLKAAGSDTTTSARFSVNAGELVEVQVPWPKMPVAEDNRYPISLTLHFDNDFNGLGEAFSPITYRQTISVAQFAKRTVRFTGKLSDWDTLVPVTVDSDWYQKAPDESVLLLNPNAEKQPDATPSRRVLGHVFTAYDDDWVYIGAAVHEDQFHCSAGEPVVKEAGGTTITLPYKQGEPDGLNFITQCGDVFQFSFGFRERVPGIGRQMGDPWAWKGSFYDTDYSFVAHSSTQGDKLIQIWGANTSRRNGYQAEPVPGIQSVPGGVVKIARDETQKLTLYEIGIPRRRLTLFNPDSGRCRFGFILYNKALVAGAALAWSDVAGVFDYWETPGSYPPTWKSYLACQTFFGIQP